MSTLISATGKTAVLFGHRKDALDANPRQKIATSTPETRKFSGPFSRPTEIYEFENQKPVALQWIPGDFLDTF